ncbi:hypothetical protein [Thalassotalea piscium]|uniref:Uncharacterized protein n=1 Tax=Thalassotalea piscium TaxID=1230533 RepID=A0A7X0NJT2_9GAMM|nr:hypothetical protein [Thalassotalea piscium]MBB6544749.1 hypothetical protein [Thalassotalea piscium]
MRTGLKVLDKLIENYSISIGPYCDNDFQKIDIIDSQTYISRFNLPHCMQQYCTELSYFNDKYLLLYRFSIPHLEHKRLGYFLFNQEGLLLEQVCFTKCPRYKKAFQKIKSFYLNAKVNTA